MCTMIDQAPTSPHGFSSKLGRFDAAQPASRLFEHTLEPLEDLSFRLLAPGVKRECVEAGGRTAVSTLFLQASKLDPCRLRTLDVWYSEDRQVVPAY